MCSTIPYFVCFHRVGNTFSGSRLLEVKVPRDRPMDIADFSFLTTSGIGGLPRTRGSSVPGWLHMCRKTEMCVGKQCAMQFNLPHFVGWDKKRKDQEPRRNLTVRLPCHRESKTSGYNSGCVTMRDVEDHSNKKR